MFAVIWTAFRGLPHRLRAVQSVDLGISPEGVQSGVRFCRQSDTTCAPCSLSMAAYCVSKMSVTLPDLLRGRTALLKKDSVAEVDSYVYGNGTDLSVALLVMILRVSVVTALSEQAWLLQVL